MEVNCVYTIAKNFFRFVIKGMLITNYEPNRTNFCAKGVMVGRFDPFTISHKRMAEVGSKLFDEVVILPAKSVMGAKKQEFLPFDTRVDLIRKSVKEFPNVKVEYYDGYTGDYAREHNIDFILRGARDGDEFVFEQNLAGFNKGINKNLTTVILPDDIGNEKISATLVRENIAKDKDISNLVPMPVKEFIQEHLSELKQRLSGGKK